MPSHVATHAYSVMIKECQAEERNGAAPCCGSVTLMDSSNLWNSTASQRGNAVRSWRTPPKSWTVLAAGSS